MIIKLIIELVIGGVIGYIANRIMHGNTGSTNKNQRVTLTEHFPGPISGPHVCTRLRSPQLLVAGAFRFTVRRQRPLSAPGKLCLVTAIIKLLCNPHSQSLAPVSEGSQRYLHFSRISIL